MLNIAEMLILIVRSSVPHWTFKSMHCKPLQFAMESKLKPNDIQKKVELTHVDKAPLRESGTHCFYQRDCNLHCPSPFSWIRCLDVKISPNKTCLAFRSSLKLPFSPANAAVLADHLNKTWVKVEWWRHSIWSDLIYAIENAFSPAKE